MPTLVMLSGEDSIAAAILCRFGRRVAACVLRFLRTLLLDRNANLKRHLGNLHFLQLRSAAI